MAAQLEVFFRRTQHGHDGIPADSRTNTTLQLQIARVFRFIFNGNSVYITARPCTSSYLNAAFARFKDLADRKSEIFDEDILALVNTEGAHSNYEAFRFV